MNTFTCLARWIPVRRVIATLSVLGLATALLSASPGTAHAHEGSAPWLDAHALDQGVYIELRHPRVIRRARSFEIVTLVSNLDAPTPITVQRVRYVDPRTGSERSHHHDQVIASKRDAYARYKQLRELLLSAPGREHASRIRYWLEQRRDALTEIRSGALMVRQRIPMPRTAATGSNITTVVEVDLIQAGVQRTVRREVRVPIQAPLPIGVDGSWFAGDQHLHTVFSIDAFFLDSTRELIDDYARVADSVGLDWIISTDHTNINVLGWYQPWMFAVGKALASNHRRREDYLVLQGQEMGVGAIGDLGEAAHLLVYPHAARSTGFLPNPCNGLVGNHVNCEPQQTIIDRVNDNGGIGFIAHPFSSSPLLYAQWDREADLDGWAGLEIFNSPAGRLSDSDERSVQWWYELLREIATPVNGQLVDRARFPTRFPVGLGNSDAHQPADIGGTFSYAYLDGISHDSGAPPHAALMEAFERGRIVASNGPLVFGDINGVGIGEVARVSDIDNRLTVTLQTTPEFGPVGDYQITVLVDGLPRTTLRPSNLAGYSSSIEVDGLLAAPDGFVTLHARRTLCPACPPDMVIHQAISNPIWLAFPDPVPR